MQSRVASSVVNVTWPLINAIVDHDWLMIIGVFTPDIWINRTEVVEVRVVRTFLSQGLLFVTQSGNFDGVLIWSSDGIQRTLFESGWPIDLPGFRRPTRPNV